MITTAFLTSRGGRAVNEDTVRIRKQQDRLCAVVADGLGGHGGGQTASATAAEAILKEFSCTGLKNKEQLHSALTLANEAVLAKQTGSCVMKSTAVVLSLNEQMALWAHVGDSRLYQFTDGHLVFQTMDQSVSQMAVLMGEITPDQIRFHEDRNRVLRALGSESSEPELHAAVPLTGRAQAFLLCSDGFWEYVYEDEMEQTLAYADTPDAWLAAMEQLLKQRIQSGNDNYTAAAVWIRTR